MDGELLTGGGLNQVFRVGDAVRRPAGPWAPRVHELLRRLAPLGIAPVPLGLDAGHELLSYLPGDVGHVPPSGDTTLIESARLLRRLHDETSRLVGASRDETSRLAESERDETSRLGIGLDGWQFAAREPVEVVLHGDFAPYNIVFANGHPTGVFDWDGAHPGPRWWDVSWAIIQFVLALPDDRERRTRLFCETYGIEYVAEHVLIRLDDMIQTIRKHPAFVLQRAERHDDHYLKLSEYVQANRA
ncbi:aminoglycoside phosphotransferase family protein [Lentzea flaviverrucosa]|uniref:Phosphotransferase enzyme family protein n=1 Tax=Lentzea flaviverrucosa TaxID=200379 RepID=A0A1H9TIX8_9PSEU|nr:aminoglycoside phosphotransferase family protein [Lentzea flaviverrucosa]RDI33585.1 phosphotransferase family enzyme [Lentzea flaviverrucosa]SER97300.1 Phosphotransferase enzyme family protein [Lentzea flaviverrucosa]